MDASRLVAHRIQRTLIAIVVQLAAIDGIAQSFAAQGACRDGVPHGAWQLSDTNGRLRALGAFNRGKRTGSFIHWSASGVRIAHMPYEEDAKNGTLALWYPTPTKGPDAQQRLEAVYTAGQLNGFVRTWDPEGRVRGEYVYAGGRLAGAKAWDARGRELPELKARAQAESDVASNAAYHATLEALVARHLPTCDPSAPPKPR